MDLAIVSQGYRFNVLIQLALGNAYSLIQEESYERAS
jgi:hypothetical protein